MPRIRSTLVAGALSTVIAAGVGAGPAAADQPAPSADCATATTQVTAAKADAVSARKAFVTFNRSMGKLIAAERAEVRTEARASRTALHTLRHQRSTTEDKATRKTLRAQIKGERADLRHSMRLLDSKKALRAQIKAERKAAKQAFTAAKAVLAAARIAAEQACAPETA